MTGVMKHLKPACKRDCGTTFVSLTFGKRWSWCVSGWCLQQVQVWFYFQRTSRAHGGDLAHASFQQIRPHVLPLQLEIKHDLQLTPLSRQRRLISPETERTETVMKPGTSSDACGGLSSVWLIAPDCLPACLPKSTSALGKPPKHSS